ncbi:MAG TPA: hypothetical protein DCY13_02265, partial [Verrucomicrobiales bacterium]|nr:hypothetical protein [Verrucomicrobiales bacterium]
MSAQRTGKIMVSFETGAMEWIDAWRSIFREGELDLWADRSLGASEDWADHFDRSLDEARAMVVLLSEKYLHSGYREHQRAWR